MQSLAHRIAEAQTHAMAIRPKVGGFPYLAEVLRQAGVSQIHVMVPSMTTTYVTTAGVLVQQGDPQVRSAVELPPYDQNSVVAAIRSDQAGETTYDEFMAGVWASGVLTYDVDLADRTCTYRSARGESYTERYASIDLSEAPTA